VDATSADSPGAWRELLAGAGLKEASVSGSGVFKDAASDALVRASFFAQDSRVWRLIVPDFGTLEGRFQIVALEYGGAHDGEAVFSMTLASAGELGFTVL
jgi:TP901-1 family phage major tail protein